MKKLARIAAVLTGVVLLIMTGLQVFLNSGKVSGMVDEAAAKSIDGKLSYSRLHFDVFRSFPRLRVTLDSLSITYPHDRFAAYDRLGPKSSLLQTGRGEVLDTLASFGRFTAAVNVWRLFGWRLRLSDASLQGLRVSAHAYPDSMANWKIFVPSPKDTVEKKGSFPLPPLSIGPVRIVDNPSVVYTSLEDTVYAAMLMKEMSLTGHVRLPNKKRGLAFRDIKFRIDSLGVFGRLPADTVGVLMNHLDIASPERNTVDVDAAIKALFVHGKLGYLHVPFNLNARAVYNRTPEYKEIEVPRLEFDAAYIPIKAHGVYRMLGDSNYVKAAINVKDCSLGDVIEKYAAGMIPAAKNVGTDARLDFDADVDGCMSGGKVPAVKASLRIPESRADYYPMNLRARLEIDLNASMTPEKRVSAVVNTFKASTEGLDITLAGSGSNLLGKDPGVKARLRGNADLLSLSRFLSDSLRSSGLIDLDLSTDTRLSELKNFEFRRGTVSGHVNSPELAVSMPYDSLNTVLDGASVILSGNPGGIRAYIRMDSVAFAKGSAMMAKIRKMNNAADISRVAMDGELVPKISFRSDNSMVFFRTGTNRIGARDLQITAGMQRRVKSNNGRIKRYLDSLQRVYPGIQRDSLFVHDRRVNPRPIPSFMRDKSFQNKDIRITLGEDVVNFLRVWSPSAGIVATSGFYATPRLPLRNRINGIDLKYDDDAFNVNALRVSSGTSDAALSGRITGLRRTLRGRGFLKGDLRLDSRHLNLNEFLTALEVGKQSTYRARSEYDESFVIDTLSDVTYELDSVMSAIVIPANLNATLTVNADSVNFSDINVTPLSGKIKVAKRCLQLTDTKLVTNLGNIGLDAFYASRSREDIQLGADLQLIDMSAANIIHMLPAVDNMMPALKSFQGNLGCRVSLTAQLDTMMNVLMPTVDGLVRINGRNLLVTDAGKLRKITALLFFKDKNIGHIDDLNVDAIIENNHLEVYPFILGVDKYKLALMGVQNFDKTMRYNVSIIKAPILPIKFGINMYGSLDDFHWGITRSKYRGGRVPVFTEQLDDIQFNIGDAIRNVYEKGVEEALSATMASYGKLEKRREELGYNSNLPTGFLTNKEFQELEAQAFENDMKEYDEEVDREVDAALAASARELNSLPKKNEGFRLNLSFKKKKAKSKK